jgi:hypothetical protein
MPADIIKSSRGRGGQNCPQLRTIWSIERIFRVAKKEGPLDTSRKMVAICMRTNRTYINRTEALEKRKGALLTLK